MFNPKKMKRLANKEEKEKLKEAAMNYCADNKLDVILFHSEKDTFGID